MRKCRLWWSWASFVQPAEGGELFQIDMKPLAESQQDSLPSPAGCERAEQSDPAPQSSLHLQTGQGLRDAVSCGAVVRTSWYDACVHLWAPRCRPTAPWVRCTARTPASQTCCTVWWCRRCSARAARCPSSASEWGGRPSPCPRTPSCPAAGGQNRTQWLLDGNDVEAKIKRERIKRVESFCHRRCRTRGVSAENAALRRIQMLFSPSAAPCWQKPGCPQRWQRLPRTPFSVKRNKNKTIDKLNYYQIIYWIL